MEFTFDSSKVDPDEPSPFYKACALAGNPIALLFQTADGTFINAAGEPVTDPHAEMQRQVADQHRDRMRVVHVRESGIDDEYF